MVKDSVCIMCFKTHWIGRQSTWAVLNWLHWNHSSQAYSQNSRGTMCCYRNPWGAWSSGWEAGPGVAFLSLIQSIWQMQRRESFILTRLRRAEHFLVGTVWQSPRFQGVVRVSHIWAEQEKEERMVAPCFSFSCIWRPKPQATVTHIQDGSPSLSLTSQETQINTEVCIQASWQGEWTAASSKSS